MLEAEPPLKVPLHSGEAIFGQRQSAVYDLLPHLVPGLMLDVGAAAGYYTRIMLAKSPCSEVIAIEPFPGNFPFFRKTVGDDPRVTLIEKAVADRVDQVRFYVGSTVAGTERDWSHMVGYSSVGYIVEEDDPRTSQSISVETIRIDDVIGNRHVRFMKIDVQGGEYGVLQSAKRAIAEGRIDILCVENSGERNVLDLLVAQKWEIFESSYILFPRSDKFDASDWRIFNEGNLSTGKTAYVAWPRQRLSDTDAYCKFVAWQTSKVGTINNDLICVRPSCLDEFLRAAAKAM